MRKTSTTRPPFPGFKLGDDNPVLETLLSHRSVRRFTDEPVSEKALDLILEAAQRAPTSSNLQSYSIIVVDEPGIKEQICVMGGNQRFVVECGVLLVFCSDISRHIHICRERGYPYRGDQINTLLVAHGDALMAGQNAAIAAESMGFGTCMLGNVRNDPQGISDLLDLPQHVYASVGLAIGTANEDKGVKPRLPRKVVVSRNRYSASHLQDGLIEYDEATRRSGLYKGRREPLNDVKPGYEDTFTDETYGWSEHSARRLGGANQVQRRNLGEFLDSKGFSRR